MNDLIDLIDLINESASYEDTGELAGLDGFDLVPVNFEPYDSEDN